MNAVTISLAKAREFEATHGQAALINRFKKFDTARPYPSVIGLAVDEAGKFPIFYRTGAVRSAKNAWSMPSGLHEAGRSAEAQFGTELAEELGLHAIPETFVKLGFYENVVFDRPGEDNWHWVNLLVAIGVDNHKGITNKEPEKHANLTLVTVDQLYAHYLDEAHQWTPGLKEALLDYESAIRDAVASLSSISLGE